MNCEKMKLIIVLLAITCFQVHTKSLHTQKGQRYISIQDKNGNVEIIDLLSKPVKVNVSKEDVFYQLYTQKNIKEPEKISHISDLVNSHLFNSKNKVIFLIHGWQSTFDCETTNLISKQTLNIDDYNVFGVDWSAAAERNYLTARYATVPVGEILGQFIRDIIKEYSIDPLDIMIIGHSLGAHVAGSAGHSLEGKIGTIVALDAAGPLFHSEETDDCLDSTDAVYVQAIHSCAIFLGIYHPVGHADFYPNGGLIQIGCNIDAGCSHMRSILYYAESIANPAFIAKKCETHESLDNITCNSNDTALMGQLWPDKKITGIYYLETNEKSPFAQGK